MKKSFLLNIAATGLVAGSMLGGVAEAAPRQYVVVLSEGLSPQVVTLGQGYLRKSDEDPELTAALSTLGATGKTTAPGAISDLKGLLETAEKNGYKTGLVTTGNIATVAPLFYELGANPAEAVVNAGAKYDFLAGGGRSAFSAAQISRYKAAGNMYIPNQEAVETEIKGGALVLHADNELSYALDRNPEEEAGLTELSSLALDTLGAGEAPFVLVVHDTLTRKALESRDSPALFEQFREVNSLVTELSARRDENPQLGIAALWTGSASTPRFANATDSQVQDSYFILSNLAVSFAGAGATLKGADAAKIDAFAHPEDGQYRGWKVTNEVKTGIAAGTLEPEKAVRASYEPAIKLSYDGPAGASGAFVTGFEAPNGLAEALKAAVSKAPAAG